MRPSFLRSGLVYVSAAVSLPFVVACWLVAKLAKATAGQISVCSAILSRRTSPRTRYPGANLLIASSGIAAIGLFVAFVVPSMPWIGFITFFALLLYGEAQTSAVRGRMAPRSGNPVSQTARLAATTPNPADDRSTRIDTPRFRLRGFGDRELVRQHVAALVDDWLCANGWKYRLVGVWLPDPKTVSPFGAIPEWWKVYQIALEDPKGLVEYGWLRFGDGKVEFRFDVKELHQSLRIDSGETYMPANLFPPEPLEHGVSADPLWDRSIDC
jgi:hypothetical protein